MVPTEGLWASVTPLLLLIAVVGRGRDRERFRSNQPPPATAANKTSAPSMENVFFMGGMLAGRLSVGKGDAQTENRRKAVSVFFSFRRQILFCPNESRQSRSRTEMRGGDFAGINRQ